MKRVAALVLTAVLITLCACSVQRFSDVKMFEKKFNKQFVSCPIDCSEAVITEQDGELQYSFVLSPDGNKNFLICLYTQEDDPRVKRCTVTACASTDEMNGGIYSVFREICSAVINSFSNGDDSPQEVAELVFMPQDGEYSQSVPQYAQTVFNRYIYSADSYGAFFCVENVSLCPQETPELTLRSGE